MIALKMRDYSTLIHLVFRPAYDDAYEKAEFELKLGQILNEAVSLIKLDTNTIKAPDIRLKAEKAKKELLEKNFSFGMKWHAVANLENWYVGKLTSSSNKRFVHFFDNVLTNKLTRMYGETNTS